MLSLITQVLANGRGELGSRFCMLAILAALLVALTGLLNPGAGTAAEVVIAAATFAAGWMTLALLTESRGHIIVADDADEDVAEIIVELALFCCCCCCCSFLRLVNLSLRCARM